MIYILGAQRLAQGVSSIGNCPITLGGRMRVDFRVDDHPPDTPFHWVLSPVLGLEEDEIRPTTPLTECSVLCWVSREAFHQDELSSARSRTFTVVEPIVFSKMSFHLHILSSCDRTCRLLRRLHFSRKYKIEEGWRFREELLEVIGGFETSSGHHKPAEWLAGIFGIC
jgi:hypothetical protein